tara:strand:- start:17968 stop:18981 length:1014 start_codon:yes stop_codon:yes gene_type:complete
MPVQNKNVLLICGGGGTEHEISLISAKFILDQLKKIEGITPHYVEITKDGTRRDLEGNRCELRRAGELVWPETDQSVALNYAIPCIHGPPGETGDIQGVFEMMGLPYLGAAPEASRICFNKVSTKLWLDALEVPNTPYLFLSEMTEDALAKARNFFADEGQDLFIKASSQGSSVGCYHVTKMTELDQAIKDAFTFSPYVLLERTVKGRELEVSVYEYQGKLECSAPGEIICPSKFYSYEEKYSETSKTQTLPKAQNLPAEVIEEIRQYAIKAFRGLKLKDLARIDFFYTDTGKVYLNEPNTFPGHTKISMFPMMMKENGHDYKTFLEYLIATHARNV